MRWKEMNTALSNAKNLEMMVERAMNYKDILFLHYIHISNMF